MSRKYYSKTFWSNDFLKELDLPENKPQYKSVIKDAIANKIRKVNGFNQIAKFKDNIVTLLLNKLDTYTGTMTIPTYYRFYPYSIFTNKSKLDYILTVFKRHSAPNNIFRIKLTNKVQQVDSIII